jgi:tRNA threonylcarbamoyladenosine biosynthesis protein TsaE
MPKRSDAPSVTISGPSHGSIPSPATVEIVQTCSEGETAATGERVGRTLRPGDLVLLTGELGAGKTAFVRGMARGVGAAEDDVSSPTFTLIQEYRGGTAVLQHVDLYRLTPAEAADLGLDDLVSGGSIVAIEWPDRWSEPPPDAIEVRIEDNGGDSRLIRISRTPQP